MRQKQIKGLDLNELTALCVERGYTAYRAKQIFQWMYRHRIDDISKMDNIPKSIRDYIREEYVLNTLSIESTQNSKKEDTIKILEQKSKKPFIRLNSPRKGYGRKGVKKTFAMGGALGDRKEAINDLIKRML